jgi:hypothetical protein
LKFLGLFSKYTQFIKSLNPKEILMRRRAILLAPMLLGILPTSAQAFPSEAEITALSTRFCTLESKETSDYEAVFFQEFGKWLNNGSITYAEIKDGVSSQEMGEAVGEKMAGQMMEICPHKVVEMENLGIFGE